MASQIIGLDAFRLQQSTRTDTKVCKKLHRSALRSATVLHLSRRTSDVDAERTAALVVKHREALRALCIETLARVLRGELTGLFLMASGPVDAGQTIHASGCFVDDLSFLADRLDLAVDAIDANTAEFAL